jgi:hypothetical protein
MVASAPATAPSRRADRGRLDARNGSAGDSPWQWIPCWHTARLRPQCLPPAQSRSRGGAASAGYPRATNAMCEVLSGPLPTRLGAMLQCLRRTSPDTESVDADPFASIALRSEHTGDSRSAPLDCPVVQRSGASVQSHGGMHHRQAPGQWTRMIRRRQSGWPIDTRTDESLSHQRRHRYHCLPTDPAGASYFADPMR